MSVTGHSEIVIVGGCGHVGLPLGIALATAGTRTALLDIDADAVATVNRGELPFREEGAAELLQRAVRSGMLVASSEASVVRGADAIVVVIGTPVDEHLNPKANAVAGALDELLPHIRDGQLLVLRSTVFPGVTAAVERRFRDAGFDIDVVFCPERIEEGKAMIELHELPQIVGARTERARQRAVQLFSVLNDDIVHVTPEEAELAKLFTNTWRYIKFATANQLYMIANDRGLDYERIRLAVTHNYPRAEDLPRAGFAAGPCLFKDTAQLAAFHDNNFTLGNAAMSVNEGLPLYVVSRLRYQVDLRSITVGILGMAFKGDSDDIRSSLSYKLRRILRFEAGDVLCTDPYVRDESLLPLEEVLERSDLLILAAPHSVYRNLKTDKPVADIWGVLGKGVTI